MEGSSRSSASAEAEACFIINDACIKAVLRIFLQHASITLNVNPIRRDHSFPPSLRHLRAGVGILTYCPSPAAFAIGLGPTNPALITIEQETLIFRRAGISPALRLLVLAFSLRNAPLWVAPLASSRMRTLSYHSARPKPCRILSFGTTF